MKKILIIACYSPLINNSAAIETLMYLKIFSDMGFKVDLITVAFEKNSIYYDEKIYNMMDKRVRLYKISAGKLFNKATEKNKSKNIKNINRGKKIIRALKKKIMIPDAYYFWTFKAYDFFKKNLIKEDYKFIFSMHEPPSSHLLALKIKRQLKIPWVTYFSDPWIKDSLRENNSYLRKLIESRLEKKVINNSDKYIFVTEENKNDFKRRYKKINENNTFIIKRAYDEEIYKEVLKKPYDKKNIRIKYIGEIFTKLRDITPFIDSIKEIKKRNNSFFEILNIEFYGNIDDENLKEKILKENLIKMKKRIGFKDAIEKIINSDILIVFGNKNSKQIPAKIYDYLGSEALILVILGDENDPLKKLCLNIENCFIVENNVLDIEKELYNIIKVLNKENISLHRRQEFSYENRKEEFIKLIKSINKD
ncbi:MAG: glycosyltransferase [Sarcina sp.]